MKNSAQQALAPLHAAGSTSLAPVPLLFASEKSGKWVATLHHEVEGVHFDPTFLSPFDLGTKSLSTVLFQLAATGIHAAHVQVSLGINQGTTEPFIDEVFRGLKKTAASLGVKIDFGHSVHSPTTFFLSLMVFGRSTAVASGAKAGDVLAVTGSLGGSTAGLQCLRRFGWPAVKDHAVIVRAHLCPQPPLKACWNLKEKSISGMAALVDGLAADLFKLSDTLECGVWLDEGALPVLAETKEAASLIGGNVRRWALYGSEDFGLVVSVSPKQWVKTEAYFAKQASPLTPIGELRPKAYGVRMKNIEGEEVRLVNSSWNPIVRRKTR